MLTISSSSGLFRGVAAELALGHRDRQVDVVLGGGQGDALHLARRRRAGASTPTTVSQVSLIFSGRPRAAIEAEQLAAHAVADHADLGVGLLVALVEEAALAQGQRAPARG